MLIITSKEIKSGIRPSNFCLFFLCSALCIFILTYLISSIIPTSWLKNNNTQTINMFGSFFLSVFITDYLLTAKSILFVDERGILIKVTKLGLGNPIGEVFYAWTDLVNYYEVRSRGSKILIVEFIHNKKISFTDEHGELYAFLKTHFSEKEQK